MKTMIHVGNDVEKIKEALPTITKSIIEILNSSAGDDVKKKALEIVSLNVEVKNVTVSNCNFTVKDDSLSLADETATGYLERTQEMKDILDPPHKEE
jgi:hypothetical protein